MTVLRVGWLYTDTYILSLLWWDVSKFSTRMHRRGRNWITYPLETWRILLISQGLAPPWASSTIFCRVVSGSGRPLTNTPPNWFTPVCPASENKLCSHQRKDSTPAQVLGKAEPGAQRCHDRVKKKMKVRGKENYKHDNLWNSNWRTLIKIYIFIVKQRM